MLGGKDWGVRIFPLFKICWLFITPALILVGIKKELINLFFLKYLGIDYIYIYKLSTT